MNTASARKIRGIGYLILILVTVLAIPGVASAGERLAVTVPAANIYSGPGAKYGVIWRVEKYTPIEVLAESNGWYLFKDFEGSKGWIQKKDVGKVDTVVVKKSGLCNIRTGPGTNFKVAFQAEKGVPFKVLSKKGDWLEIEHSDGSKGWIYRPLVW